MKFNYNRYQKNITVKQALKVNDGGLIVKSAGSATDVDESGNMIDVAISEVQDDLVNLVYKNNVSFAEFSNQSFDELQALNPNWTYSRSIRERGQSIGDAVNAVHYNETTDPKTAYVTINKNAGLDADTEELATFPLIPAHKLLSTKVDCDMSSLILANEIIDINSSGFSIAFTSPVPISPPFNFIKSGNSFVSNIPNETWIGEILDAYDTLSYDMWLNVEIDEYNTANGTWPVASIAYTDADTGILSFSKMFTGVRVNDGGRLFAMCKTNKIVHEINGIKEAVAAIHSFSYVAPLSTALNIDELGLIGIWGYSSQRKKDVKKRSGYISKKKLKANLKELAKPLNEYGIDIVAIPYEENLLEIDEATANANPGPWISVVEEMNPDGTVTESAYYMDVNYSYMQRRYRTDDSQSKSFSRVSTMTAGVIHSDGYRTANVKDAIYASKRFKERHAQLDTKYLVDMELDDVTPFTSSLREVLVAKYGPSTLLMDELNEIRDSLVSIVEEHGIFDGSLSGALSDAFTPDQFGELIENVWKNRCGDVVSKIGEYLSKLKTAAIAGSIFSGGLSLLIFAFIDDLDDVYSQLKHWYKRAKAFEYYVGESVMDNGMSIGELNVDSDKTPELKDRSHYTKLPRYLIPVDYGQKKVRYRRKNWLGQVEVATRKKDLGIRWVEIRFINTFVYNMHRKSESISGVQVDGPFSISNVELSINTSSSKFDYLSNIDKLLKTDIPATISLSNPQNDVAPGTSIFFEITDSSNVSTNKKSKLATLWNGVVLDDTSIAFNVPSVFYLTYGANVSTTNLSISRYIKPYPATNSNPNPITCQLEYSIPHLPTDTDIRDYVFHTYGPFDQGEFAMRWSEFKQLNDSGLGAVNAYTPESLPQLIDAYNTKYPRISGFEIFKETSQSIADMSSNYDIQNKASFLYTILCDTFGSSRVKIMETVRSHDDQETLQLGGDSSNFLSWHNYGLAIKINIYETDSLVTIKDGSKDFFRLIKLAEAFSDAALKGYIGAPCNVVWCGRLKTGPNIFVWEFLPLGVGHKDAIKFRNAYFNQMDPFDSIAPIDVDSNGYVVTKMPISRISFPSTERELDDALKALMASIDTTNISEKLEELLNDAELLYDIGDSMPTVTRLIEKKDVYRQMRQLIDQKSVYITLTSNAYKNAYIYGGKHYVSPRDISNYPIATDLIMKDIQEYLFMISNKFKANGFKLKADQRIIDWKLTNPISFGQMVMYYSLIGSYAVTRSLLAADYVSRYSSIMSLANINPIQFVRDFMGMQNYMNIKIYPDGLERDAGYITLHDGKLSVAVMQCRSIHPEGYSNMFGEHQSSYLTIEFGQVQDGVFTPEYVKDDSGNITKNKMQLIKSAYPILSGYALDGTIVGPSGYTLSSGDKLAMGDGYMLHVLIKDKILEELKSIQGMFDNLSCELLYDTFNNSPNQKHIIENEFGTIASQDLLSFDELADMYRRLAINANASNDTNSLGDKRGAGNNIDDVDDPNRDQSVYEKLVSTTQFTGIQFSRNTKEKPIIEAVQNTKIEKIIKQLTGDKTPDVRDII